MGTFHHDRGELHGITVVVLTDGPELFVGRCDTLDERGVVLLDVDVHVEGESEGTREEYLERVAMVGHWKKHDRVVVPRGQLRSVRRLTEF